MAETNQAEKTEANATSNAAEEAPVDPTSPPPVAAAAADKAEEAAPQTPKMRAVTLSGFGGLKNIKVTKKPEPVAGEGEIVIRVKACGLNFLDLMMRQGVLDNVPKTPFTLGLECAGEVESVGEGVTTYKPGDKVVALTDTKAFAEAVVISTKYVYKMPVGMSFQDAAALTLNFVVAYVLLFDIAGLQKGKSVLVHSAGGGVGQAVCQLCATLEDVVVFGIASKSKHESIKSSVTHLLDRTNPNDYVQEIKKVSPDGVDVVLDCLCGEDCNRGYSLLKPMGKYILYGTSSIVSGETKSFFNFAKSWWWQVDRVNPLKLYDDNKAIGGLHLRRLLFQQGQHDYIRSIVEKVFKLWQEGKIKPLIDSTYALEDVTDAMQKLHDRKNVGKIILDPSMESKPKPQGKSGKEAKDKDKGDRSASTESAEGESSEQKDKEKEKEKEKEKPKDSPPPPPPSDEK